ncbi:hypothetical protein [Desulfoscipio gibsoniae]
MFRWIEYLDNAGNISAMFAKKEFQEQVTAHCRPVQVELHFPANGASHEIMPFINQLKDVRESISLELRNQMEISILLAVLYKCIGNTKAGLEEMGNALDYLNILIETKRRSLNRLTNIQTMAPQGSPVFDERISALLKEKKILEEKRGSGFNFIKLTTTSA